MRKFFCGTIIINLVLFFGIPWVLAANGGPPVPDWQKKWDQVVAAAKNEGSLVIYGNMDPKTISEMQQGFANKYGIKLEIMAGKSAELIARLQREQAAGIKAADVFIMGGATAVLDMKPNGLIAPLEPYLILPEVKDPKAWPGGKIRFLDKAKTIIPLNSGWTTYVAVNTNLIKEGDIKSYKDLLLPKWKGKIALYDPWIAGAAAGWATLLLTDVYGLEGGKDYLRQFAATNPMGIRDVRLQVEWVARGKYPIGVGVQHAEVSQFKQSGAPININRFVEGGNLNPGSSCLEVSPNPSHPNAATLYINWLLTREGQMANSRGTGAPPVRIDVPIDGLGIDDSKIARPNDKAFLTTEEYFLMQGKAINIAKEIWGK